MMFFYQRWPILKDFWHLVIFKCDFGTKTPKSIILVDHLLMKKNHEEKLRNCENLKIQPELFWLISQEPVELQRCTWPFWLRLNSFLKSQNILKPFFCSQYTLKYHSSFFAPVYISLFNNILTYFLKWLEFEAFC